MIRWRYITGNGESAARGGASDECLMSGYSSWAAAGYPEPALRIYTYRSDCVVIGRFQNLRAEVNVPECRKLDVQVNRRMTGGGAILMGERQLMVTISSSTEHPIIPAHPARILPKLGKAMVAGLAELGLKAEFRPKNDIVVNGRKIGGTALCIEEKGAFLYHATLLLDFDVHRMLSVLDIPAEKISDKGVKSFEERLTTVNRELGREIGVEQAREALVRGFERTFKIAASHSQFTPTEVQAIDALEREKYLTEEWINQRQPAPDMLGESIRKTPAGLVHAYVALAGDTIKSVLITGDFFSENRVVYDIEAALKWGRADHDSIARTISVVTSNDSGSIQGISAETLAGIICEAVAGARV